MAKRKTVYSQAVIDFIKTSIKEQHLLPGQKVCEQSIAGEMNVSRAPVREALNVLLGEGLLISGPHLGKRVTALSVQEIRDAFVLGGAAYGVMLSASAGQYTSKDCAQLEHFRDGFKKQAEGPVSLAEYDKLRAGMHDLLLQYAMRRWDMRMLVYCANLSTCLFHKTHRRVMGPEDYMHYSDVFLKGIKHKDGPELESGIRATFNIMGQRLSVAGYDHADNQGKFVLDKKFHIHKRRQPVVKVSV